MDYKTLSEMLFPNITKTCDEIEAEYPPRNLPEGAIVSRMGPSPTGFVHLGNVVQGLTSERMAHQSSGVMFLRIEDTDAKREVEGAVESLIDGLAHYGILFDEGATEDGDSGIYGPYRQRQRAHIYHVFAKKLVSEGKAYPCFCTEQELSDNRQQQEELKENFGYYGKYAIWRDRPMEDIQAKFDKQTPWVLRFRSTGSIENKIKFTDLIKGALELTENDIDHVLLKSDGIPTYHFAHAVDDRLMRTTHVVRGDEWLPSLPLHLQLQDALGFKWLKYLHIGPLMKMDGDSKRKLSKRKDPELALSFYKSEGYPVQAVYEYVLTILNSNYEDWRRANPRVSTDDFKFSYKKMNPAGSLFDEDKLRDVSKNVIARMDAVTVFDQTAEWAQEFDPEFHAMLTANPEYSTAILSIGRGGAKPRKDFAVWTDVKPYMSFFFQPLFAPEYEYPQSVAAADVSAVIREYYALRMAEYQRTKAELPADASAWFDELKIFAEKLGFCPDMKLFKAEPEDWKGSVGDVSMILRVAVCGRQQSPDLYSVLAIMGMDSFMGRLQSALAAMGEEL